MKVVVLGCGWSGVVAAHSLKSKYPSAGVVCLDRSFDGGLLRTEAVGGYLFDVGGSHVLFSRDPAVVNAITAMGGRWVAKERRAFVLLDGVFIPYPFENGIYVLPPERRARYGLSLIRALMQGDRRPESFKEWILNTFGEEVAKDYLIPYNEKIWKRPLEELSADWVYTPGRLPLPSLEDIVKAVAGMETVGYREQAVFRYPEGGIIAQYRSALRKAEEAGVLLVKEEVKEVKKRTDGFLINGRLRADHIVSTLPLRDLPAMLDPPPPEEVFKAAGRLDYNSVAVVGLGLRAKAPPQHWVYVPDRRVVFHRYAWISNYLPEPPEDRSALIAEITIPPSREVDTEALAAEAVRGLSELGIVREKDVEVVKVWLHKYGYPIYTRTHRQDREAVERYLAEVGIATFGRWGNWHYWNTDAIYKRAMEIRNLVS
ncbi:FAD-dependent oxidoreductase [Pyrobaculum sp.]|uniref:protoporphyrinogen/coproporphyrinogen oxidase n=1 Tax=Pyrobaculum sp. TaxID=2004705 RepID=UPI00315EAE0C